MSDSKRLRLNDEHRVTLPLSSANLDEVAGDDQKEVMEQQLKKETDPKPSGDSSFKENPYIYLSRDDPALISCLYFPPLYFHF